MTRHSTDSLQFHGLINTVAQGSALTLRCLGNLRHILGITTIGPESGAPYRETRFIGERKPEITASAMAIKSLLDTFSLLGSNCVTADETHPGVRAFLQSHNPCAPNARTAGANHRRITVPMSHVLFTQLGGTRGQSAVAQLRIIEMSEDGEEEPDVIVQNADLPTVFIADEEFVIETPRIAGIDIDPDHIISWQLAPEVAVTLIVPAGSIFVTAIDITKITPRWTIVHDDPTLLGDAVIPADGIECAHADTVFPLQKRDPFGGLVDPSDEEHIEITAAGFAYHETHYDSSGSAVGTGQIIIESIEGVGDVPLTVSTGVAIDGST